jgi:hypothetical protein
MDRYYFESENRNSYRLRDHTNGQQTVALIFDATEADRICMLLNLDENAKRLRKDVDA